MLVNRRFHPISMDSGKPPPLASAVPQHEEQVAQEALDIMIIESYVACSVRTRCSERKLRDGRLQACESRSATPAINFTARDVENTRHRTPSRCATVIYVRWTIHN